jgi:hypothetical protein
MRSLSRTTTNSKPGWPSIRLILDGQILMPDANEAWLPPQRQPDSDAFREDA